MSQEIKKKGTCLNCDKQACFNSPNTKPAIYCNSHKIDGMINVKDAKCLSCGKRPNFGLPNGKPLYCSEHKTINMIIPMKI